MQKTRDFDPAQGQAYQGDVAIVPIPDGVKISRRHEIKPRDGNLILQEGEVTSHHHHIRVANFKSNTAIVGDPVMNVRDTRLRKALTGGAKIAAATARMFRDTNVASEMERRGILTRTDLMVGALVVEGGPVVILHQEHDGIRLPPGKYYIGRQVESAGVGERIVVD
jgi:hypothetical protein